MSVTLGGLRVIRCTLSIPWRGVWWADCELDLDNVSQLPAGKTSLVIGAATYPCTVDVLGSGTFSSKASTRVVGGANGWSSVVPGQHFTNPGGGLTSSVVLTTTAGLIGESVVDPNPITYGVDFVRSAGVASRVFDDRDWRVDPSTGVTRTDVWPTTTLTDGATIVDFDSIQKTARVTSDTVLFPGLTLSDTRFNGVTYTVRDVEQTFDETGTQAILWCSPNPVSRIQSALSSMVREFAATAYLKTYLYRYVLASGGGLALQGVTANSPDLNPISQWTGLSGTSDTLAPGTEIVVGFVGGDPTQPYLVSFSPLSTPVTMSLDASILISIGGGSNFLVVAPWATALIVALETFATAQAAAAGSVPLLAPLVPGYTALGSALSALPPAQTTKVKAT